MSKPDPELAGTLEFHVELTAEEVAAIDGEPALIELLRAKGIDASGAIEELRYEHELRLLQTELVLLHRDVQRAGRRIAIVFEGRDTAGKSSSIRRFARHLNPRHARIVALPKPSEVERGQWYFQRYAAELPNAGEIVFFDRSWYNRAVVEPVMGFCTDEQYELFMAQVPQFERMLVDDHIELVKLWFEISPETQARRFDDRRTNPLKQWKLSPLDEHAQERWDLYTRYIEAMFRRTHSPQAPWVIVNADTKRSARLETLRHVLNSLEYADKNRTGACGPPDPHIVKVYEPRS